MSKFKTLKVYGAVITTSLCLSLQAFGMAVDAVADVIDEKIRQHKNHIGRIQTAISLKRTTAGFDQVAFEKTNDSLAKYNALKALRNGESSDQARATFQKKVDLLAADLAQAQARKATAAAAGHLDGTYDIYIDQVTHDLCVYSGLLSACRGERGSVAVKEALSTVKRDSDDITRRLGSLVNVGDTTDDHSATKHKKKLAILSAKIAILESALSNS